MSVENKSRRGPRPGYGPRPVDPAEAGPRTSPAQTTVLRALEVQPGPVTLAALCAETALHPNTVREHLEALEDEGLVRRSKARPVGRGRPAWEYAVVAAPVDPLTREYAGLAATLAVALRRHSRRPADDALAAGREWGASLAADAPQPGGSGPVARRQAVVALLQRLRFAPVTGPQARTVQLTRCPLLDVAHAYPDVVCSIHRGMVEGALAEWGDGSTRVSLTPFAEPGACVLTLTPVTPPAR